MSREYIVVSCEDHEADKFDVFDEVDAKIHARFLEHTHAEEYAASMSQQNPGRRFYTLMGASSWHLKESQ